VTGFRSVNNCTGHLSFYRSQPVVIILVKVNEPEVGNTCHFKAVALRTKKPKPVLCL